MRLHKNVAMMFYPNTPFLNNSLLEIEIFKSNRAQLPVILKWLCQTPSITTYRVNTLKTSATECRAKLETVLAERYGTQAPKVFGLPELPEMLCIAPLVAQASVPTASNLKEIIVDASCGAALLRGAHIYAPGVLAMETGTQTNELVNVYADLSGKCKRGTAKNFESPHKLFIGIGKVLMQRYQLYNNNSPSGIAVLMQCNISGVPTLNFHHTDGLLQNLPSIVCVHALAPKPSECVLDMCAAPGNKTTHIAELMSDMGSVIALDNSANRVRNMQPKLANYNSIKAYMFDSTQAYSASADGDATHAPPFAMHTFDRILLDAPCSGLGNRPQLAWSSAIMQSKLLQSYPRIQRRLFEQAVPLLKPGGVLVYSTCTVTEAECEQIVAWALLKFHSELRLVAATPLLGGPGWSGLGLSNEQCNLVQRFGPSSTNRTPDLDTVGFFIAKFEKIS